MQLRLFAHYFLFLFWTIGYEDLDDWFPLFLRRSGISLLTLTTTHSVELSIKSKKDAHRCAPDRSDYR